MKSTLILSTAILISLALTSFDYITSGYGENSLSESIEYLPVQPKSTSGWGMVGPDGKMLFSDEFRNTPTAVINGYFTVDDRNGYTLYEASEKPKEVKNCEELYSVGIMIEGIIPVTQRNSRITLVDGKGNTVATLMPIDGEEITTCATHVTDGKLIVRTENNKFGIVNTDGKVVVKARYIQIHPYSEGYATAFRERSGEDRWVILNKKGEEVCLLPRNITVTELPFVKGRRAAYDKDGHWGFINTKGEFTHLSHKIKEISDYNDNSFIFKNEDNRCGVMNYDNEIIVHPRYTSMTITPGGRFIALDGNNIVVFDTQGNQVCLLDGYDEVQALSKLFPIIARKGLSYLLLDHEGKPVSKTIFQDININLAPGDVVISDYTDEEYEKRIEEELNRQLNELNETDAL